jgi:nucleotide-binding universal stress UspA family protein
VPVQEIVVPLDGSEFAERALHVGIALARRVGGRVMVVTAVASGAPPLPDGYVDRLVGTTTDVPIHSVLIRDRGPADAIATVTLESPDRMVCMTSHGRGGLRWAMLGSVAEEVVQRSDRALMLVGRHCDPQAVERHGPIVIAVDGQPASEAVADDARVWASLLDADLRVAVAIHPLDVEDAQHPDALLDPIVERLAERGALVVPELLRGTYVAGAIADFAQFVDASMIAMTKRAKGTARRIALGSVTMGVLNAAACPVLVTRQPDEAAAPA